MRYLTNLVTGIFMLLSVHAHAQWQLSHEIYAEPAYYSFTSTIYHLETLPNGTIVAGSYMGLYWSYDGGKHWTLSQSVGLDKKVRCIYQESADRIWVLTDIGAGNSRLYQLSASDAVITAKNIPAIGSMPSDIVVHNGIVYALSGYQVYKSTNQGSSMQIISPGIPFSDDYNYLLLDRTTGRLVAIPSAETPSYGYTSIDGGTTWQTVNLPSVQYGAYHAVFHDNALLLCDFNGRLHRSTNLGASWNLVLQAENNFTTAMEYNVSDNKIYFYAYNKLYISEDAGAGWTIRGTSANSLGSYDVFDMAATDDAMLFSKRQGVYFEKWIDPGFYNSTEDYNWLTSPWEVRFIEKIGLDLYAAAGNRLVRSPDAGVNWYTVPFNAAPYFDDIAQMGSEIYLLAGGKLFLSVDNGNAWTETAAIIPASAYDLSVKNGVLYVETHSGEVYTFTAGAASGGTLTLPGNGLLDFMAHSQGLYVLDTLATLHFSPDGGQTWPVSYPTNHTIPNYNTVKMVEGVNGRIFIVGAFSLIYRDFADQYWTAYSPSIDFPKQMTRIEQTLIMRNHFNYYQSVDNGLSWQLIGTLPLGGTQVTAAGAEYFFYGNLFSEIHRIKADLRRFGGRIFNDINLDGLYDAGDQRLTGTQAFTSVDTDVADTSGIYSLLASLGGDTIRINAPGYNPIVEPEYYLPVEGNYDGLDFAVTLPSGYPDLCVTNLPLGPFRPGFGGHILIDVFNAGNDQIDAPRVCFALDPNSDFVSSSQPVDQITGDTLCWNLPPLPPQQHYSIKVKVLISPTATISTVVSFYSEVTPNDNDQNLANNISILDRMLVGSYDPNDKLVTPTALSPDELTAGERVFWTVRFQNTGNYPADFVRILDTLSPMIDAKTVQMLSSSHNCQFQILDQRVLDFYFPDIFLPDSTSDLEGSQGYVLFSAQLRPGLPLGTVVPNTAHIYFDFNPAVVTNTAQTEIKLPDPTFDPGAGDIVMKARPNPAAWYLSLSWDQPTQQDGLIRLFDQYGSVRASQHVAAGRNKMAQPFDVGQLPTGVYFAVLEAGSVRGVKQVMVIRPGALPTGQ